MADDPLIGTQVGNYRLAYMLGEGGMGRVYAATQPQIAGRVAIKVMSSHDKDLVARFFAEARAVNLIKHPSIIKVFDLSHLTDGRPYIVMELIEGETLRSLIRREPQPIGGVARAIGEALGALASAHAIGIVHRDFKPDNVMVTLDGATKVLDFGIAKLSPWLGGGTPRTQTGARMGTPAYMAPEQIRGTGVDARTDVYAAGVMLFEAVTGKRPFRGDTEFELMRGHLEGTPLSPRSLRAEVPAELEQVILQALAKNPDDRFQTATAMANALAHVASVLPPDQLRALAPRVNVGIAIPRPASQVGSHDGTHQQTVDVAQDTPSAPAPASHRGPASAHAPVDPTLDVRGHAAAVEPSAKATTPPRSHRALILAGIAAIGAVVIVVVALGARRESPTHANHDGVVVAIRADAGTPLDATAPIGLTVVTLPSGAKKLTKPRVVDPKTFDSVAFVPEAQALARELIDDVELFTITADSVLSDGHVVIAAETSNTYLFVSPSRRKRPDGLPRGAAWLCFVSVSVAPTEVRVNAQPMAECGLDPIKPPTCHFADVWKKALAKGATPDGVALLAWSRDRWIFNLNTVGKKSLNTTFKDDCK